MRSCAGENNVFGDPAKGVVKMCQCEESLPEEGIESPTGLEVGDDIIDDKYIKEGAAKVEEDEATAARAAPKNTGPSLATAAKAKPATKPKAFQSAGEKFKAEREKMKAGLGSVKKSGK